MEWGRFLGRFLSFPERTSLPSLQVGVPVLCLILLVFPVPLVHDPRPYENVGISQFTINGHFEVQTKKPIEETFLVLFFDFGDVMCVCVCVFDCFLCVCSTGCIWMSFFDVAKYQMISHRHSYFLCGSF